MSSKAPEIQSTSPMGVDGIIRCHHGEQVDRLVSRTPKNPGREFYTCSRPHSDRCGFWFWVDDPVFAKRPPPPQTVAWTRKLDALVASNGLCTPRPSPVHSTFVSAPQSTPAKRRRPEGSATDIPAGRTSVTPASKLATTATPNKRARLDAIEAGLQARRQDDTSRLAPPLHPTTPEQSDILPFTHGVEANEATSAPSPASETAIDVEQEVKPLRVRYSFLGLPPTQDSESGAESSTPKKRSSSVSNGQQDLRGHRGGTSSAALLTPPQSAEPHTNRVEAFASTASGSSSSRPDPVTPTRHKGKERASAHWDRLIEAEENPFVDATSPSKSKRDTDALQPTPCSPRSSLDSEDPSYTPTTAERITFHITGLRDTIHTLCTYTDNLEQLGAVKYIERLERQKNAIAFREEAKEKHIATLSAECKELKEKLHQSEERSRAKDKIIASLRARR